MADIRLVARVPARPYLGSNGRLRRTVERGRRALASLADMTSSRVLLSSVSLGAGRGLPIVAQLTVARILGADGFALLSFLVATASLLESLITSGLTTTVVTATAQQPDGRRDRLRSVVALLELTTV